MGCCCVLARRAVSRKKLRTVDTETPEGVVDLDLARIHKHIVCMGVPAFGLEACYRNRFADVLRYLDHKYGENYMVYNLCSEPEHRYDLKLFHGRVREYPFPDHWACPLAMITTFVADAVQFIAHESLSGEGVVAIHCKAGKGRTGLLTCCLLMVIEPSLKGSSVMAIEYYGRNRTSDGRGLTIPSQIRYVKYYEELRNQYGGQVPEDIPVINIISFQFRGILGKVSFTSCKWYVGGRSCVISLKKPYDSTVRVVKSTRHVTKVDVSKHAFFKGLSRDVRVEFLSGKEIIGALTFHTLFIENVYNYTVLDRVCKLKLPEDAGISLEFVSTSLA
ncbi:tyrosine phosphatase [Trypanosoma grayi]|uniref:tyrosine phosphatase n=1 Tax=Trypanosoma grayi TaxID=71804 RepID=UPI0004F431C1|nr:tyrosine phosphatase [Trypanosoma grayi]KEG13736.1 tyrosine phosphatase [Trypanosoma grayi]